MDIQCDLIDFEVYSQFGFAQTKGMCIHKSPYNDGSISIRNSGDDVGFITEFGMVIKNGPSYKVSYKGNKFANVIADSIVRVDQYLILLIKDGHPVGALSNWGIVVPKKERDIC